MRLPIISYQGSPVWWLTIFHYYIGWMTFIVYPYIMIKSKQKLPILDWCFLFFIFIWLLIGVLLNGPESAFKSIRFFFGFFFFYLYFRKIGEDININALLIVLMLMVVVEAIAVNFFISPQSLPNYIVLDEFGGNSHIASSGFYQRVYSFGANASVSSVLLVAVLSISSVRMTTKVLFIIPQLLISSGSGILVYVIWLYSKTKNKLTLIVLTLCFLTLTPFLYESMIVDKFSFEYFEVLANLKINEIEAVLDQRGLLSVLIGSVDIKDVGGDFALFSFYRNYGIAGSLILFFLIVSKINSRNFIGIVVIVVTTLHYHVLFSVPGQFIAGYLLAMSYVSKNPRPELSNN